MRSEERMTSGPGTAAGRAGGEHMLNYEEELAKFTPVRTTDMLTQSVREELEQQDIAGFLMEIVEENRKLEAKNAKGNRTGAYGS